MRNFKVVINRKILRSSIKFNKEEIYIPWGEKNYMLYFCISTSAHSEKNLDGIHQEIRSNFHFCWTKPLYQNDLKHIVFFLTFFIFWEPEKMNVKVHKLHLTRNFQTFSCVLTILVKFDIHFLWCYYRWLFTSLSLAKCKKECSILEIILVQGILRELKFLNFLVDSVLTILGKSKMKEPPLSK